MKNKKKILSAVLAAAIMTGCFAGCDSKKDNVQQGNGENEFSYYICIPNGAAQTKFKSMNDLPMFQEIEKRTGVKIKFQSPAAGSGTEQFNLMLATGDYPELIESQWSNEYPGGPQKAIDDGIIVPLNDYLEKHAPNYLKALKENPDWDKQCKTDEGNYYGFLMLGKGDYSSFGGIMIRKDWLDELGLEMPETIDEWENVLRQFKDKKGASAPFTANAQMFSSNSSSFSFQTAYDVAKGFYVDNGKVKFGPLEPGYKEWIERMAKWYKEGLIDQDYAVNSDSAIDAKMTNGSSGAIAGTVGATMGKYLNLMKDDPKYNLVAAKTPVKNKGDIPKIGQTSPSVQEPALAITSNCKNIEAAIEWVDYLYSDEGLILKNFGIEGDTFNYVDGKPILTDKILHNPEGLSISDAMSINFRANYPAPGFGQLNGYLEQYYQLDQQKDAIKVWNEYSDETEKTMLPNISPSSEESEEFASLKVDITTYIDEAITKFVQGTESMDNWDQFINKLKEMKVERLIEINQKAYERYMAR